MSDGEFLLFMLLEAGKVSVQSKLSARLAVGVSPSRRTLFPFRPSFDSWLAASVASWTCDLRVYSVVYLLSDK